MGGLDRGHQACIKPDPPELLLRERAFAQRSGKLLHRQIVLGPGRIPAQPTHRSAAVIPHDQRILLRRKLRIAVVQKPLQRVRLTHVGGDIFPVGRGKDLLLFPVETTAVSRIGIPSGSKSINGRFIRRKAVLPLCRATRHHDHIHQIRIYAGSHDLIQILRRRAGLALQITAAQIEHQREGGSRFSRDIILSRRIAGSCLRGSGRFLCGSGICLCGICLCRICRYRYGRCGRYGRPALRRRTASGKHRDKQQKHSKKECGSAA